MRACIPGDPNQFALAALPAPVLRRTWFLPQPSRHYPGGTALDVRTIALPAFWHGGATLHLTSLCDLLSAFRLRNRTSGQWCKRLAEQHGADFDGCAMTVDWSLYESPPPHGEQETEVGLTPAGVAMFMLDVLCAGRTSQRNVQQLSAQLAADLELPLGIFAFGPTMVREIMGLCASVATKCIFHAPIACAPTDEGYYVALHSHEAGRVVVDIADRPRQRRRDDDDDYVMHCRRGVPARERRLLLGEVAAHLAARAPIA